MDIENRKPSERALADVRRQFSASPRETKMAETRESFSGITNADSVLSLKTIDKMLLHYI